MVLVIVDRLYEKHWENIYNASNKKKKIMQGMVYDRVVVEPGFKFDGVSIPWFATWLFTVDDMKKGDIAACFHDWMCEHKHLYKRRYATKVLVELWKIGGLPSWKARIVGFAVNLAQLREKWR